MLGELPENINYDNTKSRRTYPESWHKGVLSEMQDPTNCRDLRKDHHTRGCLNGSILSYSSFRRLRLFSNSFLPCPC